jgi:hypothetical protein
MRMAQTTIAPPNIRTLADLRKRLGNIPLDRIRFHPAPGTATEKDVVEVEERENVSCELIDGTLVEKALGFEAGVRVVWVIDPRKRLARVYSAPGQSILLRDDQALDGGDVLPGLVVPLGDLFDSIRRRRKS